MNKNRSVASLNVKISGHNTEKDKNDAS